MLKINKNSLISIALSTICIGIYLICELFLGINPVISGFNGLILIYVHYYKQEEKIRDKNILIFISIISLIEIIIAEFLDNVIYCKLINEKFNYHDISIIRIVATWILSLILTLSYYYDMFFKSKKVDDEQ